MATDKKISDLPLATTPLAGTEEQEIVQGGVNKRVAVSEVGTGTVTAVTGTTNRITSSGGATPAINIDAAYDAAITAEIAAAVALRQLLINSATALTDASSMDLTAIKHTLTTSSATRTFTISYTGDDITLEVTLNTTSSVFTFPATSLCVSDGTASGDNTCTINAASGDKIIIAIKKIGSAYYVVAKNFGQ